MYLIKRYLFQLILISSLAFTPSLTTNLSASYQPSGEDIAGISVRFGAGSSYHGGRGYGHQNRHWGTRYGGYRGYGHFNRGYSRYHYPSYGYYRYQRPRNQYYYYQGRGHYYRNAPYNNYYQYR